MELGVQKYGVVLGAQSDSSWPLAASCCPIYTRNSFSSRRRGGREDNTMAGHETSCFSTVHCIWHPRKSWQGADGGDRPGSRGQWAILFVVSRAWTIPITTWTIINTVRMPPSRSVDSLYFSMNSALILPGSIDIILEFAQMSMAIISSLQNSIRNNVGLDRYTICECIVSMENIKILIPW